VTNQLNFDSIELMETNQGGGLQRQTLRFLLTLTARTVKSESKRLHCRQNSGIFMELNGLVA
jgi:hypothetical protein